MPSREPTDPGGDARLRAADAERVLARASQLDAAQRDAAGRISVGDLRAAATEAGIARPAFDAALAELRASDGATRLKGRSPAPVGMPSATELRAGRRRVTTWVVTAALILAAGVVAASRQRRGAEAAVVEESLLLRCLTGGEALALVRPLLAVERASSATWNPEVAPRVIVVRTTPALLQRAKALLATHEGGGGAETRACPAPRP